ncbi:MAG: bifunctional phosphopantothenoylcysteine decarboxylase/phosphopantothenate--cysteine ligase CoaBC [Actinomycetota bacterium]
MAGVTAKPTVIVGVAGGVAAYKSLEVIRLLTESGVDVHVIPTLSALRFVGEASFAALSGNPVHTDIWADTHEVPHVTLARKADAIVVVPATADLMARATHGRADDLLAATLLTATCPVIFAPAMHTEMWNNPATVDNVATLRRRGIIVLEPATGRLTGPDSGKGRLPDPASIAVAVTTVLETKITQPDMAGKHVVVTAGGTREPIDPVRFLGNRSSGLQGYALASVAAARGARVTLISANVALPDPAGVDVVHVSSALDMQKALNATAHRADAIIMAAAVADFRPIHASDTKIKKSSHSIPSIELELNPDLLKSLVVARTKADQVIVGFAAETGDAAMSPAEYATKKLSDKGCDILVMNDVAEGRAFGRPDNAVTIFQPDAQPLEVPTASKTKIAVTVCDVVISRWSRTSPSA